MLSTLVSVLCTTFVLESYSYWAIVYVRRTFASVGDTELGSTLTMLGVGLMVGGLLGIGVQRTILSRNGGSRSVYRLHLGVAALLCAAACVVMAACVVTVRGYVLVLLLWLNPCLCVILCSTYYLVATVGATPQEQRRMTVLTEALVMVCAQWLSPMIMGYVLDHALHATFPIYAACFGMAAAAALTQRRLYDDSGTVLPTDEGLLINGRL